MLLRGNWKITCTKSSLCFPISPSSVLRQRVLVCKATASTSSSSELILKCNGELHQRDHGLSDGPRHLGQPFLRVMSRLWVMGLDFVCASPLLGMSLHVDVPFTGSSNFSAQESWPARFAAVVSMSTMCFSLLPLDWRVVVIRWTGNTVLCEPLVHHSSIVFWFSKFGGSGPTGSRMMQHSVPPSAIVMLSTSSPIPPVFLLARGIARCTTKCATVTLWKLSSSSFLPLL